MKNKYHYHRKKISEPIPYPSYGHLTGENTEEIEINKKSIEPVCILVEKVFSFCQQRHCFPKFKIDIENHGNYLELIDINFQGGVIAEGTLNVTPLEEKGPNFSRVAFTLKVPYTLRLKNKSSGEIIKMNGYLPQILKDIVMFIPRARNEFDFKISIETRSELLEIPQILETQVEIAIGVFLMIRVVGTVQLLIPAYSDMPEPPEGKNYEEREENIYQKFKQMPFPEDFFPPQFNDSDFS